MLRAAYSPGARKRVGSLLRHFTSGKPDGPRLRALFLDDTVDAWVAAGFEVSPGSKGRVQLGDLTIVLRSSSADQSPPSRGLVGVAVDGVDAGSGTSFLRGIDLVGAASLGGNVETRPPSHPNGVSGLGELTLWCHREDASSSPVEAAVEHLASLGIQTYKGYPPRE